MNRPDQTCKRARAPPSEGGSGTNMGSFSPHRVSEGPSHPLNLPKDRDFGSQQKTQARRTSKPGKEVKGHLHHAAAPQKPAKAITKTTNPTGIITVVPVSNQMKYPPFYVAVGTPWTMLFLNLKNWLPELKEIALDAQDSIMIQYRTETEWKPLAGDEQLTELLTELSTSGISLHLRCAPESEFRSSAESESDSGQLSNIVSRARPFKIS